MARAVPAIPSVVNSTDAWEILTYADSIGWHDPKITEPLAATVERARAYILAILAQSAPHVD